MDHHRDSRNDSFSAGSFRRKLYDSATPTTSFDMNSEVLSVREQTSTLSRRGFAERFADVGPDQQQPHPAGTNVGANANESFEFGDSFSRSDTSQSIAHAAHLKSRRSSRELQNERYDSPARDLTPPLPLSPALRPTTSNRSANSLGRDEHTPLLISLPKPDGQPFSPASLLTYIPSVALGTLLNILDGLSYGMILFPMSLPVFAGLASAGLSLFYVSTIVAQLVFTMGASGFKACIGSEMIEVVPFFHSIATTIAGNIGDDRDSVLATTLVAYALSSVVTGLVFFLLGYLKLGSLVGFFPRHILVGCIGGVGVFLVATGFEVAAPHEGPFSLKLLFEPGTFARWGSCFFLAVALMVMERRIHSALVVPGVLIATFFVFHLFAWLLPYSLDDLRDMGWVFPAQPSGEPWYEVYTYYKFNKVDWIQILDTIPAMLALTFFGIIHVPINIPALAAATQNDSINVDQELIAHGISNTISGLVGSIQNYLVYTNSVMFIKSGGDNWIAGLMITAATVLVMCAGPVIIGFIPVIVVAALIFMMGFDLMAEALVDTWKLVDLPEYLTIVAIVGIMGGYDFVVGILAGIVLACLFFVINSARTSPVRTELSGEDATSSIRRNPVLQRFLRKVAHQIYIVKLQGSLFFGTNVAVENTVKRIVDTKTIKYLVIDLDQVTDIDFCSADTFARIKRLLVKSNIALVLSGASHGNRKVRGLRAVDLIQENISDDDFHTVHVFPNLNFALEFCENQLLKDYYRYRERIQQKQKSSYLEAPKQTRYGTITHSHNPHISHTFGTTYGQTPRGKSLRQAAEHSAGEDIEANSRWHQFQQPMPLILQTFEGVSDKDAKFWAQLAPFLQREISPMGTIFCDVNQSIQAVYFVESGSLRSTLNPHSQLHETILAGTTFGELPFFANSKSAAKIVAETDVVLWQLDRKAWQKLRNDPNLRELVNELTSAAFALTMDRLKSFTTYMRVSTA